MSERIYSIDFLRGIAIIMMALFHFLFDLNYLGFMNISLYTGFWGIFQKITISLFLLLVGVGIAISRKNRGNFELHMLKRAAFLFAVAAFITAVTYILFPENFIYFGIIHLIAVSLLLAIPFAGKKIEAFVAGIGIILVSLVVNTKTFNIPFLFWLGFSPVRQTFDFVPLFPYFGLVLIGIFIGNALIKHLKSLDMFELARNKFILRFGRNSLAIYLLHQPIIFGFLYIIKNFL